MVLSLRILCSGFERCWMLKGLLFAVCCLLFAALASAICLRASCVAPVRGGTYFSLPPQRKVGKRKRANTASACFCPRAPNVPVFHTARFSLFFVAIALSVRITRLNRFFNGARGRWVCAHLRQTVCRLSRRGVRCSCQKTFCAPSFVVRQPTHRLPQMGV